MSTRGFVVSLFAAAAMLVAPAAASAAPQLEMPNGAALNLFGDVHLGDSSSRDLTIKSIGSDPVEISSFTIYDNPGAGSEADYTFTAENCLERVMTTGESCSVTIEFSPSKVGVLNTSIFVNTTPPSANNAFGVQGVGINPGIDVDPTSHDFGSVVVGEFATEKTFTVENDGTTDLYTNPGMTGEDNDSFYFASQPNCDSIAPGSSCSITIGFRPLGSPGAKSGLLVIGNNTKNENPIMISLSGTGTQPHVTTSPSAEIAFGSVELYANPDLTRSMTVTNDGTADLKIAGMILEGDNSNAFTLDQGTCVDEAVIAPDGSCTLSLTFKAESFLPGDFNTELVMFTNAGQQRRSVNAKRIQAGLEADITNVDVGDVELGQSGSATVTLTALGDAPLAFSPETPTISGSSASMFGFDVPSACTGLIGGGSCQATVTFTPTAPAGKTAEARFEGNFGELYISLQGKGLEAFVNSPMNISLPETTVGQTSEVEEFLLSNGDAPFDLSSLTVTGPDASLFSVQATAACQDLPRGDKCPFKLVYAPTAPGIHSASLKVEGNIATQTIPITATAKSPIVPPGPTPAALTLKPVKAKKIKRGKAIILTTRIGNTGETGASGVTLKATVAKGKSKKIAPVKVGSLAPGTSVTKAIKINLKKAAKPGQKLKVTLKATADSTTIPATATGIWRMRKRPEMLYQAWD